MNKEIKEAIERLETQTKDIESIKTFLSVTKIGNEEALAKLREVPEPKCKTCGDLKIICPVGLINGGIAEPCPDCQQPPAGEFTKKNRRYFTLLPEEECDSLVLKAVRHCSLVIQEACDIIDRAEAIKADLLEVCKKLLTCLRAAKAYPQTMNLWNEEIREAEAAIAKAKKEG